MSIEAHINSLSEKREHLKQRIAKESSRPMPNFEAIRELKKQNLAYKEEMHRYLIMINEKEYHTSS